MSSTLTRNQKKHYHKTADGLNMTVTIRHDDECGNGHNSFTITMDAYEAGKPRTDRFFVFGGCAHDDVRKHFPELAPFIKWHLTSTDGPMHYIANTLYHARDTDYNGKRKGEPINPETCVRFDTHPIRWRGSQKFTRWLETLENYDLEVMAVHHKQTTDGYKFAPKYTFLPYSADTWHTCPFDNETEALEFLEALNTGPVHFETVYTGTSEGKDSDLEAARHSAVWPEATLAQLQDKAALEARLPALLEQFQADVESLGFIY